MKIAFLSSLNPLDMQSWSGTLYQMFTSLCECHEVKWIGGDIMASKRHEFSLRCPRHRFIPELHVDYWAAVFEDFFKYNHFDVIVARDYFFIAGLDTHIPIVYIGDTTLNLMRDYLGLPTQFADFADEIERMAIHNATKLVYSSAWAADDAVQHYEAPPEKIHVIEFGANFLGQQEIVSLPRRGECCNLLFVAKNWEAKGGNIVMGVYQELKKRKFNFRLTIIGCLPSIEGADIEVISYLDKSNAADFELLMQKYREANFFIMPTRFDCFGIVFAEAAAFGIPSLGTDVGGVGQVLRDGVNGFLFDYNAEASVYADKIVEIYQNKEAYTRLCMSSQKDAKERLNWKVWKEKIDSLLINIESDRIISYTQAYSVPTYVINRKVREDRKQHIVKEFEGRHEFQVNWIEACEHPIGAVGLWNSIRKVVQEASEKGYPMIIVCEDDHYFTEHYSPEYLFSNIFEAKRQGAFLINGGIGGFGTAIPVARNRYWVDWFWCTQFVVIFQPLFSHILAYKFSDSDTADGVLSAITPYKMVMYPFVSQQTTFGYSDITEGNKNNPNLIIEHFENANKKLSYLHSVSHFFNRLN